MTASDIGPLRKMVAQLSESGDVSYQLPIGDQLIDLTSAIGKELTLIYHNEIRCLHCQRKTKKSYSQGYCYPCMQKLAQCDMCIMKPETCHYDKGTCREPQWGETNCMTSHYVYLANTSSIKVGITRHTQIPTRWIDQGATQALPMFKVNTRQVSGLVEIALAELIADKTNWRAMLKGIPEALDLKKQAALIIPKIAKQLSEIKHTFGEHAIEPLDEEVVNIHYPVREYLTKISSFNFDKQPIISGVLQGIKGQYLIFEHGVINMRKFTSYHISAEIN